MRLSGTGFFCFLTMSTTLPPHLAAGGSHPTCLGIAGRKVAQSWGDGQAAAGGMLTLLHPRGRIRARHIPPTEDGVEFRPWTRRPSHSRGQARGLATLQALGGSAGAGLIWVLGTSSSLVDLSCLRRPGVGGSRPFATLRPSFRQEWGLGKGMGLGWDAAPVSPSPPEAAMSVAASELHRGFTER